MRSDIQNESLDLNDDEDTQQPLPASPPPRSPTTNPLPSRTTSLPLKSNLPLASVKPATPSAPLLDEPSLEETEKDEESILFSDPHAQPQESESEPMPQARWVTAAAQDNERSNTSTDKEDADEPEHNELDASHGPERLNGTSPVATATPVIQDGPPEGEAQGLGADASDAEPSVPTQPSPHDTTPPSHSEAEDRMEEEAESVSSPHSPPGRQSPPLFSPRTPSKPTGKGAQLTPLSGLAPPNFDSHTRNTQTTPTKLASSVTASSAKQAPPSVRQLDFSTASTSHRPRDSSPEESSDFANDMRWRPRGAAAYKSLIEKKSSVHQGSPFRHDDDDDPMQQIVHTDPSTDSLAFEPTYINSQSSPHNGVRTSPPPDVCPSDEGNSGKTPQNDEDVERARPAIPSSPPIAAPLPISPPARRLGGFRMSQDGPLDVPGDAELFGDTMDSEPSPHKSSPHSQNYSFQATQVLNPAIESQSPAKSLPTPVRPTMSTTSVNSRVSESRLLKRRNRSSAAPTPPLPPRSPSPLPDMADTYTDTYKDPSGTTTEGGAADAEPGKEGVMASSSHSKQTEVDDEDRVDDASKMDIDSSGPPRAPPVLTGIHEIETGSIEHDPVALPSPNKYRRKGKQRQRETSPALSSSSSSAPSDPEDNTFQPPTQTQEPSLSPSKGKSRASVSTSGSPSKASRGSRASRRASPGLRGTRSVSVASNRTSSRPSRNKRKNFSPTPSFEGDSNSSSAPEDLEDNTYRPQKKAKKSRSRSVKTSMKASRRPTRESTKEPAGEAGPSRRRISISGSRSARAPSAALSAIPSPVATQQNHDDEPLRVLALWSKTRDYYIGTVTARNKTGYRVSFDDGLTRSLPADRMRLLQIRKGETVYCGDDRYTVGADFNGESDVILARDSKKKPFSIKTKQLAIRQDDIEKIYGDRFVPLIELESRFPVVSGGAKRSSLSSIVTPNEPCAEFENKVFLITGDVENAVKNKIETHRGTVVADWESVFTVRDNSYELSVTGVPFLIQNAESGTTMTPKVMAALAAGVPILSAAYIDEAIQGLVWWRNWLVGLGYSPVLRSTASQDIADNWGEPGWEAATARSKRQPLAGQNVLFVEPSAKYDKGKGLRVSFFTQVPANDRH